MDGMIFAAGVGSRLRPLTNDRPKALVKVAGKTLLERVVGRMKEAGVERLVVNVYHFGEQVLEFLAGHDNFGMDIVVSDERGGLLDTGGGVLKARELFHPGAAVLAHNVDILSDTDLKALFTYHLHTPNEATLLVSQRQTSRYLLFDRQARLCGWVNKNTQQTKPEGFTFRPGEYKEYAFSGIHVISPSLLRHMGGGAFSIMDFYLQECHRTCIGGHFVPGLRLIDIGKPEALEQANLLLGKRSQQL